MKKVKEKGKQFVNRLRHPRRGSQQPEQAEPSQSPPPQAGPSQPSQQARPSQPSPPQYSSGSEPQYSPGPTPNYLEPGHDFPNIPTIPTELIREARDVQRGLQERLAAIDRQRIEIPVPLNQQARDLLEGIEDLIPQQTAETPAELAETTQAIRYIIQQERQYGIIQQLLQHQQEAQLTMLQALVGDQEVEEEEIVEGNILETIQGQRDRLRDDQDILQENMTYLLQHEVQIPPELIQSINELQALMPSLLGQQPALLQQALLQQALLQARTVQLLEEHMDEIQLIVDEN